MTLDPKLVGGGAAILAAALIVFMPVNRRRVNQTLVALISAFLIFVAAFSLLDAATALPVAAVIAITAIAVRFVLGGLKSFIYRNFTRYTRRDFWQRRIGQSILGSSRRRRRND